MPAPVWPTQLPALLRAGYEINPEDPLIRTQMDAGPSRVRRRFTAIPSKVPGKWRMNQTQFAIFEAWHKYDLLDGAAWFTVNLANGQGIQAMEAHFTSPPKKTLLGGMNWEVSAGLEVRVMPVMTEAELDIALGV